MSGLLSVQPNLDKKVSLMRIRNSDDSVWSVEETVEELREILICGDRDALKLLVAERSNWRLCVAELPEIVELALEDKPCLRGRPAKDHQQKDFNALACLAKAWLDKKTYTKTWQTFVGPSGQPTKPKRLTGKMALAYLSTSIGKTSYVKRSAMKRFHL